MNLHIANEYPIVDEIVIRYLPKLRYSLIQCRHMFSCYVVVVLNSSSKNVIINIGKSRLGSRSIDCEKENFGVSLKPGENYQFKFIKCYNCFLVCRLQLLFC